MDLWPVTPATTVWKNYSRLCWKRTVFSSSLAWAHDTYRVYASITFQVNSLMLYKIKDAIIRGNSFIFALNKSHFSRIVVPAAPNAFHAINNHFNRSEVWSCQIHPPVCRRTLQLRYQRSAHTPQCLTAGDLWGEASEGVRPAGTCTCRRAYAATRLFLLAACSFLQLL